MSEPERLAVLENAEELYIGQNDIGIISMHDQYLL